MYVRRNSSSLVCNVTTGHMHYEVYLSVSKKNCAKPWQLNPLSRTKKVCKTFQQIWSNLRESSLIYGVRWNWVKHSGYVWVLEDLIEPKRQTNSKDNVQICMKQNLKDALHKSLGAKVANLHTTLLLKHQLVVSTRGGIFPRWTTDQILLSNSGFNNLHAFKHVSNNIGVLSCQWGTLV